MSGTKLCDYCGVKFEGIPSSEIVDHINNHINRGDKTL
ncbi:hypothetical protein LCGC14_0380870 [marine sediment metagenome]|uniref:Uncharacterized protein n=1 Tax=marine sediment metagenome TaxID=412755 RepID=A0A0F9VPS4_9ZZZZ